MNNSEKRPIVLTFAGPNGSGKTTLSGIIPRIGVYVNADDIRRDYNLTDLAAAIRAEEIRNYLLKNRKSFTFETVLSTERNLILLKKAKESGYEVQCFYILTVNPDINLARVQSRVASGGHDVPADKIYSRYYRALKLLPKLIQVCDKLLIYDNSERPELLFEKLYNREYYHTNNLWSEKQIINLIKLEKNNL